jgi:hypothetical protein
MLAVAGWMWGVLAPAMGVFPSPSYVALGLYVAGIIGQAGTMMMAQLTTEADSPRSRISDTAAWYRMSGLHVATFIGLCAVALRDAQTIPRVSSTALPVGIGVTLLVTTMRRRQKAAATTETPPTDDSA